MPVVQLDLYNCDRARSAEAHRSIYSHNDLNMKSSRGNEWRVIFMRVLKKFYVDVISSESRVCERKPRRDVIKKTHVARDAYRSVC